MASPKSLVSREVADAVHRIAALHGVHSVRVFGSVARGEQRPDSDIDLLVDLEPRRSLLDLIAFAQDLEEALGRHVDAVTERSLSPYLRDKILAEALPL
jgi:predicted nucleotidyltransferase